MLQKNTVTLLRLPFSFFLMPVFFFALSQVPVIDWGKALLIFVLLHFLLYPASNGYNSYMDRDVGSIGLLEHPPPATRQLYVVTLWMDVFLLMMSLMISLPFLIAITANVAASRAYSYRGIRLKRYPVAGFLTVVLFQGAVTFFMVYVGANGAGLFRVPWAAMGISTLLFGGFYPLTQVYQHQQDLGDGVHTISSLLGIRGTFIFSALWFLAAEISLYFFFSGTRPASFFLLQLFFCPVAWYFIKWFLAVTKDPSRADYPHAMRMNLVAAVSMNTGFILLFILHLIENKH